LRPRLVFVQVTAVAPDSQSPGARPMTGASIQRTLQRTALQKLLREHHLGALLEAIEAIARTSPMRLPYPVTQLALMAGEVR
jgi:hypothetical protein